MSTKETREEWIKWLVESRKITPEVMIEAQLNIDVERGELGIPVFDADGHLLFYKYRRSPWHTGGPKYRYEAGSTAALYGAETLANLDAGECVVVTEGELDALAFRSLGQPAVSTTGGSGTWREEWSAMLAPFKVVIAYDADRAGVEGALKVASVTPNAKVAWLPVAYGKDPTEILSVHDGAGVLGEAIEEARSYVVPHAGSEGRFKALVEFAKVLHAERKQALNDPFGTPFHVDLALAWVEREISSEKDAQKRKERGRLEGESATKLAQANTYPIAKLLKVNRDGFALCPFHTEKTASFKVYKDNHAYCHGTCGKKYDAVDVYMQLNRCDFKTAINALI